MAGHDQGTGQHKHKSSEEPFPHHESSSTKGESKSGGGQRATGSENGESSSRRGSGSSSGQESSDLKSREYKGPDGEIHHHTKKYEEQHKH